MDSLLLLSVAGFLAGVMNAIAGGGSFLTFPALLLAGLPSVTANTSSTVALYPGSVASVWAYRSDLAPVGGVGLAPLLATSLLGGAAGAALLIATPSAVFDRVVPFLLLLATLALAFGRRAGEALRRRIAVGRRPVLAVQLALAVYGGYFGGAVGIMMMAVWTLVDGAEFKAMNPAKTLLVAATNTVAVACFAAAGAVRWPETLVVLAAGSAGGYAGARLARRLDPRLVRAAVLAITATTTLAFFLRAW
jgi:hypothetical protein